MKKKTENNQFISQSKAAEIAGVSRQAINGLKDRYNFFSGKKVDTHHPHWHEYIEERNIRLSKYEGEKENVTTNADKVAVKKNKSGKRGKGGKQKQHAGKIKAGNVATVEKIQQSTKQKNALYGGVSPDTFTPRNLADVERMAKIQNLNLQMRVRLGELVERDMVEKVIDVIANTTQSYFIDLPRKVSGVICKKLDRVGMEKSVEALLSPQIAKGISEMKKISLDSVEYKIINSDDTD